MVNQILFKNMESLENNFRLFCKLGKCLFQQDFDHIIGQVVLTERFLRLTDVDDKFY